MNNIFCLTLKTLRERINSYPNDTMQLQLSEPFSWRGGYDEVCFSLSTKETSKKDNLKMLNKAVRNTFYGWKGGEYRYNKYTTVNFELGKGYYSDGLYLIQFLANNHNDAIQHIFGNFIKKE